MRALVQEDDPQATLVPTQKELPSAIEFHRRPALLGWDQNHLAADLAVDATLLFFWDWIG
jgi:hypothetical protein